MRPIKLRIRKKMLVPTKHNIIHAFRSDWKLVDVIDYTFSLVFFSRIKNDAQFAGYLKNKFGVGIYSVVAWKKGREGFYSFIKLECFEDRFKRLPKKETIEQKEARELNSESRRLQKQLNKGDELSEDQKKLIQGNIQEMSEDIELNKEISDLENVKRGPSPYLHTILPIYKEHEYQLPGEEIIDNKKQEATIIKQEEEYKLW